MLSRQKEASTKRGLRTFSTQCKWPDRLSLIFVNTIVSMYDLPTRALTSKIPSGTSLQQLWSYSLVIYLQFPLMYNLSNASTVKQPLTHEGSKRRNIELHETFKSVRCLNSILYKRNIC